MNRPVVISAAVVGLAGAVLTAPLAGASDPGARTARSVVLIYLGKPTVKPARFGGNHWGFSHLRWTRWGAASAKAAGDAHWSFPGGDGEHHGRVTLRFSQLRTVCGHRTYTQVTFRARGDVTGEGGLSAPLCEWSGF